ncbi:6-phosphogluconolactonase [Thalassomonas sp. M1454]|uniref:6-phosphogluconolactonase n=1 Tax=Thalassomonas sp. M1454 TaxID=2594477 RepID=UPI00117D92A2|nr:6-phosphogluconolactonase [Thalassomonas sp. M1454]TRX56820.1 6-phosphogluconolactonase [Thalassomonas sp. M1454]
MHNLNTFESREQLDQEFATKVAEQLAQAIANKGRASIAFSGGSTPKGFFNALSQKDIDWSKVTVTLADDRWVDVNNNDSNDKLIRENLLINKASSAQLFSLKQEGTFDQEYLTSLTKQANNTVLPLDIVILGMGEDGHTASIFPCSEQVHQGLSTTSEPALMKTIPTTAPYERITFNFNALIGCSHLYLHIVGQSKQDVLNQALANDNAVEMPIRAFLHNSEKTCEIIWAE